VARIKATGHNLRRGFHPTGVLVDGDDRQHKAVFAEMPPVFDYKVFNDICPGTRVDTDATNVDASGLTRSKFVEFEHVAAFNEHHAANGAVHGARQFGMQFELAVLAVNGDEVLRPHQVD